MKNALKKEVFYLYTVAVRNVMKAVAENDAKDKVQFSLVLDNAFKQQHCVGSNSETVSIT